MKVRGMWAAALLSLASLVSAQKPPTRTYVSFDPPGSIETQPVGIADNGYVAGEYKVAEGKKPLIFLRSPTNGYVKFPHPAALRGGIDAAGDVLGIYGNGDSFDPYVGFVRYFSTGMITYGYGLGEFAPTAMNSSGICPGALYNSRNGFLAAYALNPCLSSGETRINVPDPYWVGPVAINTIGNVAGAFQDHSYVMHGFVWNAKKQHAKVITVPNSISTQITGMNDAGTAAGAWEDSSNLLHSFFVTASGAITTFDPPNAQGSWAIGINDAGAIGGNFCLTACRNGEAGYVRNPDGTFSTIGFPGSTVTDVSGINKSGTVTGTYVDTAGVSHGFTY
jgi:hypothetical protein